MDAYRRHRRQRVTLLLSVALLPMLITGCAGAEEETVTPQAPVSETASTNLTITTNDGAGGVKTWQLTCDPTGGTHPAAEAACAALAANGETAMPPVAIDAMCTQQFGGPQTATVTGTWNGAAVEASFTRGNGCEISRWDALKPLLEQ